MVRHQFCFLNGTKPTIQNTEPYKKLSMCSYKTDFPYFKVSPFPFLEIGFGTGLNAFITYLEAQKLQQKIEYTGIEAYPVAAEDVLKNELCCGTGCHKRKGHFFKNARIGLEPKGNTVS